eukprot:3646932-Pleurochrysis_carterae.AAC.1
MYVALKHPSLARNPSPLSYNDFFGLMADLFGSTWKHAEGGSFKQAREKRRSARASHVAAR